MNRVEILKIMEVLTTEPYSQWQNKSESFIKTINGKSKKRRVHRYITKRVWYFNMVWEAEIYSHTIDKDGRPYL